jgi:hypothetical protein
VNLVDVQDAPNGKSMIRSPFTEQQMVRWFAYMNQAFDTAGLSLRENKNRSRELIANINFPLPTNPVPQWALA